MESIAVVIIIGIMIVLGLVFAFNFKSEDIKIEADEQKNIQALTIALRASSLEELKCSSFTSSGNLCLDLLMIQAVSQYVTPVNDEAYKYYYDQFKTSKIVIKIISPELPDNDEEFVLFDYAPEPVPGKESSLRSIYFPVLLYDPINNIYYFSMMEAGVYS